MYSQITNRSSRSVLHIWGKVDHKNEYTKELNSARNDHVIQWKSDHV